MGAATTSTATTDTIHAPRDLTADCAGASKRGIIRLSQAFAISSSEMPCLRPRSRAAVDRACFRAALVTRSRYRSSPAPPTTQSGRLGLPCASSMAAAGPISVMSGRPYEKSSPGGLLAVGAVACLPLEPRCRAACGSDGIWASIGMRPFPPARCLIDACGRRLVHTAL